MESPWKVVLKQAGVNKDQCVDVHGIEGSTFDAIDMEFYYPSEHIADPMGIGKNYKVNEISKMLEDLEEFSIMRDQSKDKQGIITEKIIDSENTD